MGGEIAPSKYPFGHWISIELTIFALRVLHDIPTPFAVLDNGMTGSAVEAAPCLLHKDTVRTRFDRDTFHRFLLSFYKYTGHLQSLYQATELSPGEGTSLTILRGGIAVVVNCQQTGRALARHSRGTNVDYGGKTIIASASEDKDFPTVSDNERPLF